MSKQILTAREAHNLVVEISKEIENTITKKLDGIHPDQKWVVIGRVFNLLLASFYRPIVERTVEAEAAIEKLRGEK